MLQVKNLVKRYVTASGTVTALDHVSIDFPRRGMVFLLGKSGSGKSTLLNVSGGLDEPDEGEVIVNGKSSKEFTKSDFDSFRNTYVGFVFQEYNILGELTVEENVALALELQGRPRDRELVEKILREVDLGGLGERRPATLSGGQKQRVAIARALVKDPQIIMADEPTGALDSKTGAQVFDTLKKLSKEKLVVVVSHDRDFAEGYADRIIELCDGAIVSDMSRVSQEFGRSNLREISQQTVMIARGSELTEEDEGKILAFMRKNKGEIVISTAKEALNLIPEDKPSVSFSKTSQTSVYPQEECNFIKSKFPIRYALKMGVSGLKVKPLRLIFTTLLAVVAFVVFGVFSTLITYNTSKAGAYTLADSHYHAAVLKKHGIVHITNQDGESHMQAIDSGENGSHFSEQEVQAMRKKYSSMHYVPAYTLDIASLAYYTGSIPSNFIVNDAYYGNEKKFTAFADGKYISELGYTVYGELPRAADECAVSKEIFGVFQKYGYGSGIENKVEIETYEDLIGKTFRFSQNSNAITSATQQFFTLKITGVVDTEEDFSYFAPLKEGLGVSKLDYLEWNALLEEWKDIFTYSMSALCWVGDGFYEAHKPDYASLFYRYNASVLANNILDSYYGDLKFSSDFLKKNQNGQYVFDEIVLPNTDGETFKLFYISPEAEAEGSYVQYLFAPLTGNRLNRSLSLFSHDRVEVNGYYYEVPYSFMQLVRVSGIGFTRLTAILGTIAVVLAVFAALLLYNFISASINAKEKEIGILRAVGARGGDVYKIFMVEGLVITISCFLLGSLLSWLSCTVINAVMIAKEVLYFKLFLFDWVNVFIVFAIALVTAAVSTIVPVALAVRKKPVEAIRSL